MDIFEKIESVFGSQANAARVVGLKSRQTIGNWKRRGRIPAEYYQSIVEASNGEIEYQELLPNKRA